MVTVQTLIVARQFAYVLNSGIIWMMIFAGTKIILQPRNIVNCRDNLVVLYPDSAKKVTMCVRYLVRNYGNGIEEKGEGLMSKTKGVSSKTHTKKQCDDYANQHNPNNKAYLANRQNKKAMSRKPDRSFYLGDYAPSEWFCYSNPFDFD